MIKFIERLMGLMDVAISSKEFDKLVARAFAKKNGRGY